MLLPKTKRTGEREKINPADMFFSSLHGCQLSSSAPSRLLFSLSHVSQVFI